MAKKQAGSDACDINEEDIRGKAIFSEVSSYHNATEPAPGEELVNGFRCQPITDVNCNIRLLVLSESLCIESHRKSCLSDPLPVSWLACRAQVTPLFVVHAFASSLRRHRLQIQISRSLAKVLAPFLVPVACSCFIWSALMASVRYIYSLPIYSYLHCRLR